MKIYNEDESPLGRAWILPYDKMGNNFLVFNSYNTRNYNLIFFARLLAIYLGGIYEIIYGDIPNIYTNHNYFYFVTTEGAEFYWEKLERYLKDTLIFCPTCEKSYPVLNLKTYTRDSNLYCPSCDIPVAK